MNNVVARIGKGIATAGFVFACFAAYAFLSPATFRSTSVVVREPGEPKREALELALDLERSLLEPDFLRRLAGEITPTLDHPALTETMARIRTSLEVNSLDGSKFVVAYRDSSSARAQWICDVFARRAVEQLPRLLAPPPEPQPSQPVRELVAFLSRHPELSSVVTNVALPDGRPAEPETKEAADRTANALRTERWKITARLNELSKAPVSASDNPYPERNDDPDALRARLAKIDAALAPRLAVTTKPTGGDRTGSEEQDEFRRLLAAISNEKIAKPAEIPTTTARVLSPAQRPAEPVSPARSLLLWIGAMLGTALGACVGLLQGAGRDTTQPRRTPSQAAPRRASTERIPPARRDTFPIPLPRAKPAPAIPLMAPRTPPPVAPMAKIIDLAAQAAEREPPSRKREERRTLMMGTLEVVEEAASALSEPSPEPEAEPVESAAVRGTELQDAAHRERPEAANGSEGFGRSIVSYSELVEQSALVAPYDVPVGWHPDSSLDVARLRSMARDLYPLATERPFVVAITATSGAVTEKSRTAAELALALAEFAHRRVLLLEGNFTRPAIQRWMRLKIPNACGFTRQLQAYAERRLYGGWKVARCTQWLDVCAEGAVRTPGAMLAEHFTNAVGELQRHYGFIVIDGPSLDDTSDCRALDRSVEGVVVVRDSETILSHSRLSSLFSEKRFSTVIETAA